MNVKIITHYRRDRYQTDSWTLDIDGKQYMYYHHLIPRRTTLTLLREFQFMQQPSQLTLSDILLPMNSASPAATLKQFHKLLMLQ